MNPYAAREQKESQYAHEIYDMLCVIEHDIINQKINLDVFDEVIHEALSIYYMYQMPKCILIKIMQISQLLLQLNHPNLDDCTKKFQQFVKKYEDDYKQLNLIQNNESYSISKAYIFDKKEDFSYVALSPNEKYLLVGTSRQVYLYDIKTKLNIKIFKEEWTTGLFSSDSRQIILVTYDRVILIDIRTSKIQLQINKMLTTIFFMNKSFLYLTCDNTERIIKIHLKSSRQLFSYDTQGHEIKNVSFFQELTTLQSYGYLQILNEEKMKSKLTINFMDYKINQFFLINKDEMLSNHLESQLIIWNIDYQNNILIKQKVLPFYATQLLSNNPSFGYFYLISKNEFQIIDENYNSIYTDNKQDQENRILSNQIQLNSNKIFILFQQDGVYILKRHIKG